MLLLAAGALFAATTNNDAAVTELGRGINAYNTRDFNGAITHLQAARANLPAPKLYLSALSFSAACGAK